MKKTFAIAMLIAAAGSVSIAATDTVVSENTFGILQVQSSLINTLVVVPFDGISSDGTSITVANLVKTAGLTANDDASNADQLVIYDQAQSKYFTYSLKLIDSIKCWTPLKTVAVSGAGETETLTAPDPYSYTLSKGTSFWLLRRDTASPIYIYGQMPAAASVTTIAAGTMNTPSYNMVGKIGIEAFNLNDGSVDWVAKGAVAGGPVSSDQIQVVTADGQPFATYYFYKAMKDSFMAYDNKWVSRAANGTMSTDVTIPAGYGFWYIRRGAEFSF